MDLVVRGGALPTFLLERLVAATGAARVEPPQAVRLRERSGPPSRRAGAAARRRAPRLGLHAGSGVKGMRPLPADGG